MRRILPCLLLPCLLTIAASQVSAWDALAHRLHSYVTFDYLSADHQQQLYQILQHHPRFEADFQARMPDDTRRSDQHSQRRWMLGQAAIWPDLVRGLPEPDRQLYNRPEWHWIDGRWMAPDTDADQPVQGNVYLGTPPLPSILGHYPDAESAVGNMMQAFEYTLAQLADTTLSEPERAIALCWVLHLAGDIHQPLHSGALFSRNSFATGDRGGNAIATDAGNLHARWDQALRGADFADSLQALQRTVAELAPSAESSLFDSAQWLQESREILHVAVYSEAIREAVLNSERSTQTLQRIRLDASYVENMYAIATERLSLASLRLTAILSAALEGTSGPLE